MASSEHLTLLGERRWRAKLAEVSSGGHSLTPDLNLSDFTLANFHLQFAKSSGSQIGRRLCRGFPRLKTKRQQDDDLELIAHGGYCLVICAHRVLMEGVEVSCQQRRIGRT